MDQRVIRAILSLLVVGGLVALGVWAVKSAMGKREEQKQKEEVAVKEKAEAEKKAKQEEEARRAAREKEEREKKEREELARREAERRAELERRLEEERIAKEEAARRLAEEQASKKAQEEEDRARKESEQKLAGDRAAREREFQLAQDRARLTEIRRRRDALLKPRPRPGGGMQYVGVDPNSNTMMYRMRDLPRMIPVQTQEMCAELFARFLPPVKNAALVQELHEEAAREIPKWEDRKEENRKTLVIQKGRYEIMRRRLEEAIRINSKKDVDRWAPDEARLFPDVERLMYEEADIVQAINCLNAVKDVTSQHLRTLAAAGAKIPDPAETKPGTKAGTVLLMNDGTRILALTVLETETQYVIKDEAGKVRTIEKKDVAGTSKQEAAP